jgi:DNA-binding Lrp family transcriptional regulator
MRRDVENNKRKIITSLRENGPQTTSELVESTELSRDTIFEYCKKLSRSNLIRKNGKFGKYYLTGDGEVYGHPTLKGINFARRAMKIFGPRATVLPNMNDRKNELEQFGDKIGALFVYSMIQSLAPKIWNPNYDGITIGQKIGKERDLPARQWLRSSVNPSQILAEFSNLNIVKSGLSTGIAIAPPPLHIYLERHCYKPPNLSTKQNKEWQKNAREAWSNLNRLYEKNKRRNFDPHDPYQSNFELDVEGYTNLLQEFKKAYPEDYIDFEEIWNGLDDEIK